MSKRKKPDPEDWSEVKLKTLSTKDLRLLLQTRKEKNLPKKRNELEDKLKTKDVEIDYNEDMTTRQLLVELKLRGLDDSSATKKVYLKRLRGEIAAEPKKKNEKKKHRAMGAKVFLTFYQSPMENNKDDGEDATVLGVFTSSTNAYNCIVDKLLEDLKKKNKDRFDEMEKERSKDGPLDRLLKTILEKCEAVFGDENAPNGWVSDSTVE